jgi:hypothetical protein
MPTRETGDRERQQDSGHEPDPGAERDLAREVARRSAERALARHDRPRVTTAVSATPGSASMPMLTHTRRSTPSERFSPP